MFFSRLRLLLLPFSWLYGLIMVVRNLLFDFKLLKSVRYPFPVISVGNITVGGTGKTPLAEYIIGLIGSFNHVALLSRGYGRQTKGVLFANSSSTYLDIGDEPLQIKQKFDNLTVVVAEKRVKGMECLTDLSFPPSVVVMDDAYQHRYVSAGLSILVCDYNRPLWSDYTFPAGNLREPRQGKKRSDIVIVNKCPIDFTKNEAVEVQDKLRLRSNQHLFFTAIKYGEPLRLDGKERGENSFRRALEKQGFFIVAFAGIGNPSPFFDMVDKYADKLVTMRYRDHYRYREEDLSVIEKAGEGRALYVTTEKDGVRLKSLKGITSKEASRIWYFPVEPFFLFNRGAQFDKLVKDYVGTD
ncbi:tetraacyldisaccharide 4'-kinase [Marinilabiliaceae bacterium ANBcel2]|nr:tetraacyldisaccharide 4'-kinase [Marinilabiliaceae bacterium ANBcel2]